MIDLTDENKFHDPTSSPQELERLLDRYPFHATQLQILLHIKTLSSLSSSSEILSPTFSTIIEEATRKVSKNCSSSNHALQWIETYLIPPQTLNALLHIQLDKKKEYKKDSTTDTNFGINNGNTNLMNHISQITGRRGDPNYGLIYIFNLLADTEEEALNWTQDDQSDVLDDDCRSNCTKNSRETFNERSFCENSEQAGRKVHISTLLDFMYRLALACHVLQNWNEEHNQSTDSSNINFIHKGCDDSSDCQKEGSTDGAPFKNPKSVHRQCPDLDQVLECLKMRNMSMVSSLKEFSSKSTAINSNEFNDYDITGPNLMDEVDCKSWLEWNKLNFPQMSSIPSSFMHLALLTSLETNKPSEIREEPQRNQDRTEYDEGNEAGDGGILRGATVDKLSQYAMGNRTMFRFPTLEKAIMASSNMRSIGQEYVTSIDVKSDGNSIIDNGSIVQGGRIGHFAFGLVLMDARLCGKVSQ